MLEQETLPVRGARYGSAAAEARQKQKLSTAGKGQETCSYPSLPSIEGQSSTTARGRWQTHRDEACMASGLVHSACLSLGLEQRDWNLPLPPWALD